MKSTDRNLNNPMLINQIPLGRYLESWELPVVTHVTQEEYDLIKIKDPFKIYKITNSKEKRVYYGNTLLEEEPIDVEYLIGVETAKSKEYGEFIYYIMMHTQRNGIDEVIKICMFRDLQAAANAVVLFNTVRSHEGANLRIYNIVNQYIQRNISIHDFIIGIMCAFGLDHDVNLNEAILLGTKYEIKQTDYDLPILLRDRLPNMRKMSKVPLIKLYADIYDVVVKYDFFKGKEYQENTLTSMGKVIGDFYKLYM